VSSKRFHTRILFTDILSPGRRLLLARILALLAVIAITVYVYNIRDQAEQLARYGYPGIFLLSILANATVLLPAPGIVFVFFMGAVFNPVGVAIAAGLGAAIGEMSGYLAGFSGQAIVENTTYYQRILGWMENNQFKASMVILVLAFIPNPFFDLAGISAGTLRMPVIRFLFFCAIGKILKMFIFAYAGYAGITTLQEFFSP
jgi:membrane protein YqaA with SNARE-associated domain